MNCVNVKPLYSSSMTKKKSNKQSATTSKSTKSLTSNVGSTPKIVKRKASAVLSATQQKKSKHIPKGDDSDSTTTADPHVDLTKKQRPIVVDIDSSDSDSPKKSSVSVNVEDSDDELGKHTE